MVFPYSYCIYFFIALWLAIPSAQAQEQLTDFRGSPCCYSFEKIIPHGGINYGLALDHQDGVRIYLLNETEATLVFSNDQDDKITLIEHALLEDFYYFIYQDRIELFRFSSGEVETYEFDDPLSLNRIQKEALSMGKYGLTLIPESETEALQFFNLSTKRFETKSPSLIRGERHFQLDSFILYSKFEDGRNRLFSHNMLTDEIHILHSIDNQSMKFLYQNGILFYSNRDSLFITNGSPRGNFSLSDRKSFSSILSYQKDRAMHVLFRIQDNQYQYFKIKWDSSIVNDFIVSTNSNFRRVRSFYRINQEELFLFDRTNFLKSNLQNGSASFTEQRWARNLFFDRDKVFYDDITLKSFNYLTEEVTELSETNLSDHIQDIRELFKVNDSLFYFIAHNEGRFEEEVLNELFAFDLIRDTIVELLPFGDQGHGIEKSKLIQLGQKLILRTKDEIHEWTGQEFSPIFTSEINLPILYHREKYYFVQRVNSGTVSIYEWKDQDQIVPVAKRIPHYNNGSNILSVSDQLLFINRYFGAYAVDLESGSHDTLSPYDMEVLHRDVYPVGKYIVRELRVVGRGNEFWSYHPETRSWVQLETDDIQRPENISEIPNQAGEYILSIEYSGLGDSITSTSLRTGKQEVLLKDNQDINYYYRFIPSCDDKVIISASSFQNQTNKLYITDGTKEGTREILDLDISRFYSSFFRFDGDLIFSAIDTAYTKVFRLGCEDDLVEEALDLNPFVPQDQFSLGNQIYTLGYKLFPQQNLTLSRNLGNRVEELRVSPYDNLAADDIDYFETLESKPRIYFSDSLLAIAVSLDEKGEELWSVGLYGQLDRMTDLNQGPFDSEIDNLVAFGDYLYFTGYKYGVGKQVWRMPFPNTDFNTDHNNLELLIAPNPTDQFLTIYDMPLEKGEISIFDMSGKPVFEGIKNEGTPQFSHNMQPYPPGMYIVLLRVNGKPYSGKFILK